MVDATAVLPGMAPQAAQSFSNQTVRQVLRLSLGGDTLRLKVSNLFGASPLTISGVRVARSTSASAIDATTDRAVTFSGQSSVTIPAGVELYSDPVALAVAPLTNIAVSMYFASATSIPTVHPEARQTAFIGAGNQLSASTVQGTADPFSAYFALTAVETSSLELTKVVVAFGDSLTDGSASTIDAARRFPNLLDDRLKAAGFARTGVVNAGIGGNRWANDYVGPNGSSRFDRDVLGFPSATHTIILLGINDIGFMVDPAPDQEVTAQDIIAATNAAVNKAKGRGLKVLLGTLAPYRGAGYFSEAGELERQAVNAWIRTDALVDAVVDFDQVLRNPAEPSSLNPAFDSGDHLHPNDAGYAAMAAAVNLASLQ
jgi:lysophospholipase L1-like esterase